LPAPGPALVLASPSPFRFSFIHPHPRTRLLGQSSHGVRCSFTAYPRVSVPGLSAKDTSLGVRRPFSARGGESPRPPGFPVRLPRCYRGGPPAGPTLPPTVPLSGFLNLSAAFFLSPPSCHFQASGARGILPFRGLLLSRRPDGSSPPACPHDVLPTGSAVPPFLGGDFPWAHRTLPRMSRPVSLRVFRAFVRGEIDLRHRHCLWHRRPIFPSWAFSSSWSNPRNVGTSSLMRPSPLYEQWVRRQIHHPLRLTACHSQERALCYQRVLPSQGSSPSPPLPAWVTSQHGLQSLRPFTLTRRVPRGTVRTSLCCSDPPANAR
jgi:hypothetical protein